MLESVNFDDVAIVEDMSTGFRLTGPIIPSASFRKKRASASMTQDDLRGAAKTVRKGILMSCRSSGDTDLDLAVHEATQLEIEKKWLWGLIDESMLPAEASVSRRFGVWQGDKCRPIDNLLESGINSTTSAEDTISIHTVDCTVASLAFRFQCLADQSVEETTGFKTWDLKKVYKQLPIHVESRNESYLAVFDPNEGRPKIYGQRILPFGSRASVHTFCRAATGIWAVGVSGFYLRWTAYFDDFVLIEAEPLQRLSDLCVTTLFTLLGWITSVDKGSDFSAIACVLGLELPRSASQNLQKN